MKTRTTLLLALLSVSATAQITLNVGTHAISPGDQLSTYDADTSAQPGAAGANITWNLSTLPISSTLTSVNIVAPNTTTYSSSFPTATAAAGSGTSWQYYRVSGNTYSLLGTGNSTQIQSYQQSHDLFTYPFTYNTTTTDNTILCNYTVSGFNYQRTGTSQTKGDAYGTLILPSGTFSNLLRVKVTYTYKDSMIGFNFTGYTSLVRYSWFNATSKTPVFQIDYITLTVSGNSNTTKIVSVGSFAVGVNDLSVAGFSADVYPNPANGRVNVSYEVRNSTELKVQLLGPLGQAVREYPVSVFAPGSYSDELDISGIAPGVYYLRMNGTEGSVLKKLVIQ